MDDYWKSILVQPIEFSCDAVSKPIHVIFMMRTVDY